MKNLIAKILIAVMAFTTVITPIEFGFAETTENTIASENVAVIEETEETVTEEMQFLYLEQQKVEAPGVQNIAVSWEENINAVSKMILVCEDSNGEIFNIEEKERTEKSILFTRAFSEHEIGTYTIKEIIYYLNEEEQQIMLDDMEINAEFKVVDEIREEDGAAIIATEDNVINNGVVQSQVEAVLEEAQAESDGSNKNVIVVLDPGHGGDDPGATRKLSSKRYLYERDLNLKIAQACYEELQKYAGIDVYMTRSTNEEEPSLIARVKYAASLNADVLISLHNNAAVSNSAKGAEVWAPNSNYNKTVYKEGQALSASIQKELTDLGLYDRGVQVSYSKDNTQYPDKSLADYYGIIRESKKLGFTGIIVEHAFLSNDRDREFLMKDENLKALGVADAKGIAAYYGLEIGVWEKTSQGKKYKYADGTYATGYIKIDSAYYYFDADGIMQKYSQIIDGKPYYFRSNGKGTGKGWITCKNGSKLYSLGKGRLATGYKKVRSSYYYFDVKGVMQKSKKVDIDGKTYYFTSSGKGAAKGWIKHKNGKKRYSYGKGQLATGYKKIGKYYYFFNESGIMQKSSVQMVEGKPYYFKTDGKAAGKGWIKHKNGKKRYCYGKGKLAEGYKKIGKYYYFFNETGIMQKSSIQMVDGKPYYFKNNGRAAGKGWIKHKNGNKRYCYGKGKLAVGTVTINGTSYDFSAEGLYIGKTASKKYDITGKTTVTVNQMVGYYKSVRGSGFPKTYKNTEAYTIETFCQIYYDECKAEGIKAEVAFCQAMKETGWLKFGGDVSVKQYNFAGIGATGGGNPGHSFDTITIGVRAHVQHLKAYANTEALVNECVDPRFKLVKRGAAPYVEWLGQKANPDGYGWAPAATYGTDVVEMIKTLKSY